VSPILIDETQLARIFQALGYAIIGAVAYALLGYFKRHDTTENFDGVQFITTLVVGIIAGFAAFFLNITPQQALTLVLAEAGLISYIEDFAKAVWRRWVQPWIEKQSPPAAPPAT